MSAFEGGKVVVDEAAANPLGGEEIRNANTKSMKWLIIWRTFS